MKRNNYVVVDADRCKGCRLCVENCPKNCLEIGENINTLGYQNAVFVQRGCTACGNCHLVCPEAWCISVFSDPIPADQGLPA